jgi:glycosyltransferase involved in cell wall biosynthesis
MRVCVTLEYRFDRTPDGAVWTQTAFARSFWSRYLEVFDRVLAIARVRDVESVPGDWKRADGEGVTFAGLPYYVGPLQYVLRSSHVDRAARSAVEPGDAVIMRVGSQIASRIEPLLRRRRQPFGVEVVGDPYDVFAPGVIRHPLRPFLRWWFSSRLRGQCAAACGSAYVTEKTLQRRYPCPAYSVGVSDVEISPEALVSAPRPARAGARAFTLVTVASLAQLYKAPDVLIDAVAACVGEGLDLRLVLVGDGRYRPELETRAAASGVSEQVRFLGQLTAGGAVRAELDGADLFVLPSRTEGLPRALIEAMARALPCIGSQVGGFPELLPAEDLVPPGDTAALARKIREIVSDPERMARMSARNLARAGDFREEVLHARRIAFYRHIRATTEEWIRDRGNVH